MAEMSYPEAMIKEHGSIENAIAWLEKNLSRSPVENRINYALLLNIVGREEESFAVSDELLAIAPNDQRVLFNRGWHLIKRKEFRKGHELLENGRAFGSYGDRVPTSNGPIFNLQNKEKAKHTMLVLEGGLGDQIIQARFADIFFEKTGEKIHLVGNASLLSAFSRLKGVAGLVTRESVSGLYHEQWIPGMSSQRILLDSFEELTGQPYLSANEIYQRKWTPIIEQLEKKDKLKVGIRWAGSPKFEHQQLRKFPPNILTELRYNEKIQLFSLQRDNDLIDLPSDIVNLGPFLDSWEDTIAAISEMDLVISSCTSVAHMAGALGKKTWVVVPVLPYFIWALPGDHSPWYKSVTLFRQEQFGTWEDVHKKLIKAIDREF